MRLEVQKPDVTIAPMDKVEIIDGPFDKVVGTVIEIDKELLKAKVMVEMFGRNTPIDVNLDQIRKIN
jgi:transcriptional antiterminator NusG